MLFTFEAVKNLSALPTYYVSRCFVFFCQFWVYLGINSLSQRISKIDESKKFQIFDIVFKLEFEVKN